DELPAPLPKSGRPKLLSPRTLKVISRQVWSNPSLTAREVKERNPRLLSHVSLRYVQQALHNGLGFKSFRARRKPLLTKRQKENRVKFCKKYEVWDLETWRSVLWSDEATFSVTGNVSALNTLNQVGVDMVIVLRHNMFCDTRQCKFHANLQNVLPQCIESHSFLPGVGRVAPWSFTVEVSLQCSAIAAITVVFLPRCPPTVRCTRSPRLALLYVLLVHRLNPGNETSRFAVGTKALKSQVIVQGLLNTT
ncbi:putative Transposable element Tcb1 transposase-like 8, partial [Homarus americanus]